MSQALTRLSLVCGVLAVVFSFLPSVLERQKEPAERLGDTLVKEGQTIVDSLLGKEEPTFEIRFDGPFLWPSLAVIAGALAFVVGLIAAVAGGTDRFIPTVAALIGAAVVVWQVWMQ